MSRYCWQWYVETTARDRFDISEASEFRLDYEYEFDFEYDFLETFRFDYEYNFDHEYDFLEIFRFDYEYEFDYEYDFLETFRFDYEYEFAFEYDFLTFELVMLTTRSSAILVVNRRADTRFDRTTILRTPGTNIKSYQEVVLVVKLVLVVKSKGL